MVARAMRGEYRVRDLCQRADEKPLCSAIERLVGEWPTFGYRRVTALLKREGQVVNRKRVQRLMQDLGLQVHRQPHKVRTTDSKHDFPRYPNLAQKLVVERPDQLWVADITYVRLGKGCVYQAGLMDVFTRAIRGWSVSRSLDRHLTIAALKQAMQDRCPDIHHSDQGVQYMQRLTTLSCSKTKPRSAWPRSASLPRMAMRNA